MQHDDCRIRPGSRWREEIADELGAAIEALDAARAALVACLADHVVEGTGGKERVELKSELMGRREAIQAALAVVAASAAA